MTTAQAIPGQSAAVREVKTAAPGLLRPAISLCRRELVRFLRQRHRIIGALVTPLVFWLFIGGGMGRSISFGQSSVPESYIRFFFPGTLVMILLFTAIFSTISIIEDRREGFLQSVLIAPVSRSVIVLGKVLGGTVLASGQGLIFLLLAPLVGFHLHVVSFAIALALMIVVSFALTTLGFCIAWRMSSTQWFHAIMNLFLMPMWFLSGALFPAERAWIGIRWLMTVNPLTYGLSGIRAALLLGEGGGVHLSAPALWVSFTVSCAFAAGLFVLASIIAQKNVAADLM